MSPIAFKNYSFDGKKKISLKSPRVDHDVKSTCTGFLCQQIQNSVENYFDDTLASYYLASPCANYECRHHQLFLASQQHVRP